ncbi:hypothetical protein [Burkholderia ubonensis]|uniref:hypothetical protein n=1 Tax=Burkholderia ubonensis TaxID=101571 RepID=UPI0012F7FAB2|nr:hypothetical protein [Burkholderia ubonensis]
MVIRLSGCISHVLVAVSLSFFVQYGYSRDITRLTIDGVGLSKNANDRGIVEACKKFVPTLSQVRRYFLKAYPVESYVGTTQRYSDCYATGSIEYSDKRKGAWTISSGGTGGIVWARGDYVHLFYKYNKWHDPFACSYGSGDEGEC